MTHKEYLAQVGVEIKVARIRKGMTTKQVGTATGLSEQTINGIERGKKDAKILSYKRVADALGANMKDFM